MDPTYILLFVLLGAFIVFQVFQGRKRKRETESRQSKFVPGVEIMTNYGVYGTIVSIDEERNLVMLETSPGVEMKIHRQTILKIADYDDVVADDDAIDDTERNDAEEVDDAADAAAPASSTATTRAADEREPEFGERLDPSDGPRTDGADRATGDGTAK